MNKILLLLITNISITLAFSQGIKFNDDLYDSHEEWEVNDLGFTDNLPISHSMRKYCPKPGDQGNSGSCVGWANAYAAMSIIFNKKFDLSSDITKNSLLAFDPYFIYSLIYMHYENDCSEGTHSHMALDTLHFYGCKRKVFPEITACNSSISDKSKYFAREFKIKNYYPVPKMFFNKEVNLMEKVNLLKDKISQDNPLVIGASTFGTIDKVALKSSGLWDSYSNENDRGGHAMCVVGYDDNKFGGAFEVMNSWGNHWGDEGFLWIKYDDFIRKVNRIFLIETYDLEPFKIDYKTCYLGNCKNGYGFLKYNENSFYEGEFRNGKFDGIGIKREVNGIEYVGRWNNGKKDGTFILYNSKKDISYKVSYNNDLMVDKQALGFASKENRDELMNEDFINHLESQGVIILGDEDNLEINN